MQLPRRSPGAATLPLDFGMGAAMVQRDRLSDLQKSSAFWLTTGVAIISTSILFVAAPLVGRFYHTAAVVPIVRALSITVVFAAFEAFFAALLSRGFQFRTLGLRRIVATLFAGVIGIACATQGMGAWALVAYSLVNVGLSCLLLVWKAGWLPTFDFSCQGIRDLWSFGRPVLATRVVNYIGGSVDKLLVGRYLGSGALGLYSFSYQAVLVPLNFFSRPIGTVSLSILSSVQSDLARCGRACKDGMALVIFVAWPCAAIVALSAPIAVPSIVGDQWVETVPVIQVLSCAGAISAALNIILQALLAVGRPAVVFRLRLLTVATSVVGFALGLRWGIEGVALGFLGGDGCDGCVIRFHGREVVWVRSSRFPVAFPERGGPMLFASWNVDRSRYLDSAD